MPLERSDEHVRRSRRSETAYGSYRRIMSRTEARKQWDYIKEAPFMRQIIEAATVLRWRWWHDAATNFPRACRHCKRPIHWARNPPGFPDLVLLRDDTLYLVEVKKDDGERSEDQIAWGEALSKVTRVVYHVWRPKDMPRILKWLGAA